VLAVPAVAFIPAFAFIPVVERSWY
jgi:hypothetical protein